MTPRPPELRPYRIAAWALYLGVTSVAAFMFIRAVVLDLWGRALPAHKGQVTDSRCLGDLERLYSELNAELWSVSGRGRTPAEAAASFNGWSRRWERDLEGVQHACSLDGVPADPTRAALADAAVHLDDLRGAYVAHMARFAEEGGPEAHDTRAALDRARAAVKQR